MARLWFSLIILLCAAACAAERPSSETTPPDVANQSTDVDPAKIRRLRPEFPSGYEVAPIGAPASPATAWGFRPGWSADPPQCAALADPADEESAQGLSGSGPGGIIYAAVASSPSPGGPDPQVVDDCARWSMTSGTTVAQVERIDAPAVGGADTVAMVVRPRTVVEGGTQTKADAHTATAYLGPHVVFVTVVTDPGSPQPQLPPEFAATFLELTVATLRG